MRDFCSGAYTGIDSGHVMAESDTAADGLERKLATILSADVSKRRFGFARGADLVRSDAEKGAGFSSPSSSICTRARQLGPQLGVPIQKAPEILADVVRQELEAGRQ